MPASEQLCYIDLNHFVKKDLYSIYRHYTEKNYTFIY